MRIAVNQALGYTINQLNATTGDRERGRRGGRKSKRGLHYKMKHIIIITFSHA